MGFISTESQMCLEKRNDCATPHRLKDSQSESGHLLSDLYHLSRGDSKAISAFRNDFY